MDLGARPSLLGQAKKKFTEFMDVYSGQVKSNSAVAAMNTAKNILDRVLPDLKIAKGITMEVFLIKALVQHKKASEANEKADVEKAATVLDRELAIISDTNPFGILADDLNSRLYVLSRQIVQ